MSDGDVDVDADADADADTDADVDVDEQDDDDEDDTMTHTSRLHISTDVSTHDTPLVTPRDADVHSDVALAQHRVLLQFAHDTKLMRVHGNTALTQHILPEIKRMFVGQQSNSNSDSRQRQ